MTVWEDRIGVAKAFVFDFYGTLVEDDVSVQPMWEHLNQLGYQSGPELQAMFEPDAFDGCTTPHVASSPSHDEWNRSNWREFVRLSGVPDLLVDNVLLSLLKVQDDFKAKAAPSARSMIEWLRGRKKSVGICSNWESPIAPYLEQAGLSEAGFDAITTSAEIGARKPHSMMFTDVCAKLAVERSEAVFVGDNWSSDIVGALRSGLTPVWIRRNRRPCRLPHLVAEFDTLAEFETYLRRSLR
jgi:putative hydrolase of the HAD superfamily